MIVALKALDARPLHADTREAVIPTKGIDYSKWDHLSIYSSDEDAKRQEDIYAESPQESNDDKMRMNRKLHGWGLGEDEDEHTESLWETSEEEAERSDAEEEGDQEEEEEEEKNAAFWRSE